MFYLVRSKEETRKQGRWCWPIVRPIDKISYSRSPTIEILLMINNYYNFDYYFYFYYYDYYRKLLLISLVLCAFALQTKL